ncbi:LPS translocon maturation chaperone LptM [Pseudogulbenkiania subflava]|uniref:Lipoprotein-attachment site-containing protein n=1 Tax=Pseudogulbenkiania subflava DSM 22618 TaxID=1123014 RepID=A0A1Y6BZP4_9NEIS|nr:lipoprotein [Pseudogulbenkiania subflava]SMF29004.1 hypothetical protein SAMN02745746_02382 [Pseudogulbenkiania subflava DSM 22618]
MRTMISLAALCLIATACGYKAPLYLPKDAPAKHQHHDASAP